MYDSERLKNSCPTLLGEFGIPFDIDKCKAYRNWAKGKRKPGIWKKHIMALDLMYNAMDRHLIHGTHWNYTASNRNDELIGDGWNQEDFSIYSNDQRDKPDDLNSGGRAIEGFVRPFPHYVQGEILETRFDRRKREYILRYFADASIDFPTEIFIPGVQFPKGYTVQADGVEVKKIPEEQKIIVKANKSGEILITINSK